MAIRVWVRSSPCPFPCHEINRKKNSENRNIKCMDVAKVLFVFVAAEKRNSILRQLTFKKWFKTFAWITWNWKKEMHVADVLSFPFYFEQNCTKNCFVLTKCRSGKSIVGNVSIFIHVIASHCSITDNAYRSKNIIYISNSGFRFKSINVRLSSFAAMNALDLSIDWWSVKSIIFFILLCHVY